MSKVEGCDGLKRDTNDYHKAKDVVSQAKSARAESETRYQRVTEREKMTDLEKNGVWSLSVAKYQTTWRGIPCMKDAMSFVQYAQLLHDVKPRTIFEYGAYAGGSALWFADTLDPVAKAEGFDFRVHAVDLDKSLLHPTAQHERCVFYEGDQAKPEADFPAAQLKDRSEGCPYPHPWLIVDDSHVHMSTMMRHFAPYMQEGDYFVIEDLAPNVPKNAGIPAKDFSEMYGWVKYDALQALFAKKGEEDPTREPIDFDGRFLVDTKYNDMFGYNSGWNWDGFLRCVG